MEEQNDSNLSEILRQRSRTSAEFRQISKRLRELLPERYRMIRNDYIRKSIKPGKATRLALLDPRFFEHVEELTRVSHDGDLAYHSWLVLKMKSAADTSLNFSSTNPPGGDPRYGLRKKKEC